MYGKWCALFVMCDDHALKDHIQWFVHKISSDSYQTYDEDDPLLTAILEKELRIRNLNIDMKTWCMLDRLKRSVSQNIGTLWQRILGSADGWQDLRIGDDTGCDLKNEKRKIVMELKNKWNTMNSSALASVIGKLEKQIEVGYDAYVGIINPKGKRSHSKHLKNGVKEISGDHLFEIIYDKPNMHTHIVQKIAKMYQEERVNHATVTIEPQLLSSLSIQETNNG